MRWTVTIVIVTVAAGIVASQVLLMAYGDLEGFKSGFLGNLYATIIGVIVGITLGLALDRLRQDRESASRQSEVIEVVGRELKENRRTLGQRVSDAEPKAYQSGIPFLQDQVWEAVRDGGDLRWVSDQELRRLIGRAEDYVRDVIYLERRLFELRTYPGQRAGVIESGGMPNLNAIAVNQVESFAVDVRTIALRELDGSIAAIEQKLGREVQIPVETT